MALEIDQELMRMLLDTFAIQFDEQVQSITDGLLVLERCVEGEERRQVLESVFRAAHNIKGAARGVEIPDVPDIAHHLESIFSVLKRENINPNGEVTDIALESLDGMRQAMTAFSNQQPLGFDKDGLIARLSQVVAHVEQLGRAGNPLEAVATETLAPVHVAALEVPSAEEEVIAEEVKSVETQTFCTWDPNAKGATEKVAQVERQPASSSGVVKVNLEKLESLAALTEEFQVAKIEMDDHLAGMQQMRNKVQELMSSWRRSHVAGAVKYTQQDIDAWLRSSADAVAELDSVSAQTHREMRSGASRLGILVESLQDGVRMMRLVPVATLMRPMTRSVRDIARELNKKVNFEVIGDDIEIDRVVLDGVRDPLMHLLRNALDHGIETAQARLDKGKPAEGTLRILVSSEGRQIVMTIQDDGEGISVERIAASALKKKIVTEAELAGMSHAEVMDLIFRPGFSSREIITNISGRGVGLDVVAANLVKLKGTVQVVTEVDKGTSFILRLPITMSADNGVLVRLGTTVFAIPTSAVDRIMEIKREQIIEVEASHAIMHRGHSIPLRDLALTLELASDEQLKRNILPVIVINKGRESVAFLVDEVIGEREIVVKPFRPPLHAVRNVTGGTLTGSGEVIMVLNPSDLVNSAMRSSLSHLRASQIESKDKKIPHILVVDDSITTRTLEKSILEHAGYDVTVAVDGKRAWDLLQAHRFDLVVSDVEMPIMTGLQLTERIKKSDRLKGIPVIIVTSLAKDEDRQRGIEVGADAYIVKGLFETKVLLDVVEQLI